MISSTSVEEWAFTVVLVAPAYRWHQKLWIVGRNEGHTIIRPSTAQRVALYARL